MLSMTEFTERRSVHASRKMASGITKHSSTKAKIAKGSVGERFVMRSPFNMLRYSRMDDIVMASWAVQ